MATSKDYSRSIIAASDEVQDILCEPCEQDGRKTEAEGYCVDCPEYLCGQCYKNHKLYKAFRNHVLQDRDNMPQTGTGVSVKDACVQKCSKHPDEIVKYFCESCDSLGCSTCMILDHRQCKKVDDIPKLVTSQETQEEFQTFIKKVDKMSNQIQESRNAIRSVSNIADDLQQVAMTELEKQHDEIDKFFDDLKKEMHQKINEIHRGNGGILAAASNIYDNIDKKITNIKSDVNKKKTDGQNCEAFINMKQSESEVKKLESELTTLQTKSRIQKYEILPSPKIQDMMRNIKAICRLETESTVIVGSEEKTRDTQQLQTSTTPSKTANTPQTTTVKSLRLHKEININTSNDKSLPYVRGITVIHKHYIVVADNVNKSVKVLDQRNDKVISEMIMNGNVWNVTTVKDDKIAVGLNTTIQFLSVSKSGSLNKEYALSIGSSCFDLVYSKDRLIFVQSCSTIQIIDMQGIILKTFKTDSDGKNLFISAYGLALSSDNETIYVSDKTEDTVTSMTMDGKVKVIYKDSGLKTPRGIATDNDGHIYVCSSVTQTIHQLSADCDKLQVLENTPGGSCITYTNTNKLLAGCGPRVRIYNLV